MRLANIIAVFMVVSLCLGLQHSMAQGPNLAALDIVAIKSIQLRSDDSGFYSEVKVLFKNDSDKAIKFKNANFDITFKDKGETIPFGNSPLKELVVPPKSGEGTVGGQTEAVLDIKIGPKDDKTVMLLIKLFNIIGNPSNSLIMILEGTGEVGHKIEKGWIYQTGMRAELEFVPTIQREILFK